MSSSRRGPLKLLVLLAIAAAIVVSVRNATADSGGVYDPEENTP